MAARPGWRRDSYRSCKIGIFLENASICLYFRGFQWNLGGNRGCGFGQSCGAGRRHLAAVASMASRGPTPLGLDAPADRSSPPPAPMPCWAGCWATSSAASGGQRRKTRRCAARILKELAAMGVPRPHPDRHELLSANGAGTISPAAPSPTSSPSVSPGTGQGDRADGAYATPSPPGRARAMTAPASPPCWKPSAP